MYLSPSILDKMHKFVWHGRTAIRNDILALNRKKKDQEWRNSGTVVPSPTLVDHLYNANAGGQQAGKYPSLLYLAVARSYIAQERWKALIPIWQSYIRDTVV